MGFWDSIPEPKEISLGERWPVREAGSFECDVCGGDIVPDQDYVRILGKRICMDCINDNRTYNDYNDFYWEDE